MTLILGKIEGKKRREWQRMEWLYNITYSMDMDLSKLQEIVKHSRSCHAAEHRATKSQTQLRDWTMSICKKMRLEHFFTPYTKENSCVKNLNVILATLKHLWENKGRTLIYIKYRNIFWICFLNRRNKSKTENKYIKVSFNRWMVKEEIQE